MVESSTLVLAGSIVFIFILYLLTYSQFRAATKQSVIIPAKTIRKLRSSVKKDRQEVIVKLDYEPGRRLPAKRRWRKGSSDAVSPGIINREEVIIHTHPRVTTKDRITNAYETMLRERPSLADLKFSKRRGRELLVTPSGKVIEFSGENADLSRLKNLEVKAQTKAARIVPPTDEKSARISANIANQIFITEARKAGVEIRELKVRKNRVILKDVEVK